MKDKKRMNETQLRTLWDLYSAGKKNVEISKEMHLSEVNVSLAIKRMRSLMFCDVITDKKQTAYVKLAKTMRAERKKKELEEQQRDSQVTEPTGVEQVRESKSELPESYQKLKDMMDSLPKIVSEVIEFEVDRQVSPIMEELEMLRDHAKTSNWVGELQKKFQGKSEPKGGE